MGYLGGTEQNSNTNMFARGHRSMSAASETSELGEEEDCYGYVLPGSSSSTERGDCLHTPHTCKCKTFVTYLISVLPICRYWVKSILYSLNCRFVSVPQSLQSKPPRWERLKILQTSASISAGDCCRPGPGL